MYHVPLTTFSRLKLVFDLLLYSDIANFAISNTCRSVISIGVQSPATGPTLALVRVRRERRKATTTKRFLGFILAIGLHIFKEFFSGKFMML